MPLGGLNGVVLDRLTVDGEVQVTYPLPAHHAAIQALEDEGPMVAADEKDALHTRRALGLVGAVAVPGELVVEDVEDRLVYVLHSEKIHRILEQSLPTSRCSP